MNEYEQFYTYDDPIPINGLFLKPVTMRQYIYFYENIRCLLFNKNRIPDPTIISMSYLEFLLALSGEDKTVLLQLENILLLCFDLDKDKFAIHLTSDAKKRPQLTFLQFAEDQKTILNSWDFNYRDIKKVRQIICEQNAVEMPNEKIDPNLEKALMEAQEYIDRHNDNSKTVSLEEQMISVLINSSLKWADIMQLSIRKFVKILARHDTELHYQIYKTASSSGMVTFKNPITHYLRESNQDKYAHLVSDYNQFKDKMSAVASQ